MCALRIALSLYWLAPCFASHPEKKKLNHLFHLLPGYWFKSPKTND